MIKVLAIDDEPLALRQLVTYINKVPFLKLAGQCRSALEARQLMGNLNEPDNAEMYRSVALVCIDWREHTEQVLDTIEFKEETT